MNRTVPATARAAALLLALTSLPAGALLPLDAVKIDTGAEFSCALTPGGAVKCWGANRLGQLGDGSFTSRSMAVEVSGLASGVVSISAGGGHACALNAGGGLKCWGANLLGQLGDGSPTNRSRPVEVSGLASGVASVSAGDSHTCAVTTAGGVKCWGDNGLGQLGDGSATGRSAPIDVPGLASGIAAIAAGAQHTCALTAGGAVKCWGNNSSGQLGDGSLNARLTPVDVIGLSSGVAAITAGGFHTCALTAGGAVKCWGRNDFGQLGDTVNRQSRLTPTDVPGLGSGVALVAAGIWHTCALTTAGGVKCWGDNGWGQVDGLATSEALPPTDVPGLTGGAAWVSTGYDASCALTTSGRVRCWGTNFSGGLGDGSAEYRSNPGDVSGLAAGVSSITAGNEHTCALTTAGGAKCWGENDNGQLGDGTSISRVAPVDVSGLASGVGALTAGAFHTCALTAGGGVKCWGGQPGDISATPSAVPVDVPGLGSGVAAIAAGSSHTCALTAAGAVKCWGRNFNGQLGDGSLNDRLVPADVVGLSSGVAAIAAGGSHACALTGAGAVKCWGRNSNGQLGDATLTDRRVPTDVVGLSSGVATIDAGASHTCALTTGGGVKCWGSNLTGELGDGSTTGRTAPVDVSGLLAGAAAIAAGPLHTCAVMAAGHVKCWGDNTFERLGSGSSNRTSPVDIAALSGGVTAGTVGDGHSCVIQAGAARCWGRNFEGQLGDGTGPRRSPVEVRVSATRVVSSPGAMTNSSSASFGFASAVAGPVECSLDGAPYAACVSPLGYSGLAAGTHAFRVRARDSLGNPDPDPPSHYWTIAPSLLNASAPLLDFGAQSMKTASPAMTIIFTNPTASPVAVISALVSLEYDISGGNCATVAPSGSCQMVISFFPQSEGSIPGWVAIVYAGGATVVDLVGVGERSLVTHYYRSILRRDPDAGGKAFWTSEATRVGALGADVNEVWYAMAQQFYASAEYGAFNRDDAGFVTDLYTSFLNRAPDPGGLAYWTGQLTSGLPREVLLAQFMFSSEFGLFARRISGVPSVRAEVDTVVDFYRGLLARLPDSPGFNYWLGRFRSAQCQGGAAVVNEVEAISSAFTLSGEYAARARTNAQYVGDLYNAFMRRGGDLGGVQYWINQVASGARTREEVRIEFKKSAEFQGRVSALTAQGCLQ